MIDCRELCPESIEQFRYGLYLEVMESAANFQVKCVHPCSLMGIRCEGNELLMEHQAGAAESDVVCCSHRLQEVWNGIGGLAEEPYLEFLEPRDGEPRKKRFQVSAHASESEPTKVGKRDMGHGRHVQQLASGVGVGNRGVKADSEGLKLRHG